MTLVNKKRQGGRLSSPNKRSDLRDSNQLKRTTALTCDICGINHFKSKESKICFLAESEKAPQEWRDLNKKRIEAYKVRKDKS